MKVVLIGYMASGKSTIGRYLAQEMDMSFIDLDVYIEEKEEMTITDIFKTKGEIYFRYQEHFYLKELLAATNNIVIALGGGTPCYASNMQVINNSENTYSIYLKANVHTLVERLKNQRSKRPLVAELSDEKLQEYVAKHLFERNKYYNQASSILPIDNKSITEIVTELKVQLH
ncbi:shikimate kinase [Tenacibaculum sp. UWU-22]|uniref:shikimate kinase n=1 Tax=Tenacibaculum sp. UWU-22 TaxID=3234187 RepID=UPI0034DB74B3